MILFSEKNYKKQALYQNYSLALHTDEIFHNLFLRNYWTWTWKISGSITAVGLTLWYIGHSQSDLDSENTWNILLDSDWFYDILELDLHLDWFNYILGLDLNTWSNLLDSDWFYYNQAGMLLENSENLLELFVKQLVIQLSLAKSIVLGQAMFGVCKTKWY